MFKTNWRVNPVNFLRRKTPKSFNETFSSSVSLDFRKDLVEKPITLIPLIIDKIDYKTNFRVYPVNFLTGGLGKQAGVFNNLSTLLLHGIYCFWRDGDNSLI